MTKQEYEKIGELLSLRKQFEDNIETFQYCIAEAYIKDLIEAGLVEKV